jgi:aminopeptidase 2
MKTTDLWAALSEASGKNVEEAMATWTKKIGYPVVTVTEDGNKLHLKQNRYLKTADVKPEEDETLWPIFVGLRTKDGVNEDISFNTRESTIEVEDADFFKLNADQSAVYRTLYSPERLKKLGEAAKSGLLSVEDRAGLLGDAGALATSGYQKTSALLDLVAGFKEEESYVVWAEIASRIGSIKSTWLFAPQEERNALKQFHRELMSPLAHKLGWKFTEGDDELMQQLKSLAFSAAGLNGDPEVVEAGMAMFKKFAEGDLDAIHPNLRGTVYGIALENGENQGEKEVSRIVQMF